MPKKIYDSPEIWSIDVPLPNNPLRNLNCYVVRAGDETLVIDTGFRQPECAEALFGGLKELGVDLTKTKLFLTHLHSDHTGLIGDFAEAGSKIYMGEVDLEQFFSMRELSDRFALFDDEGFPQDDGRQQMAKNPAIIYAPTNIKLTGSVTDGQEFKVGDLSFTCIHTPGHTPGHVCLYLASEQIMFLGDHILFDITPNITMWIGVKDSLGDYLNSLDKIEQYPIKLALPAHRNNAKDVYLRIAEIRAHHDQRLQNTLDIITANPGANAHDIASKMKWSMRGRDWSEFPVHQKWFAMGETIAHLNYLLYKDKITKTMVDGVYQYNLA
ncbi:MAG: MBL fold metallo-hydrolase [Ruminococcaceae bacterium]|nr:MBL fold metallo-hydrolase [Oscillospiraceae bacterium]